MQAARRPNVMACVALAGAGLVAVTPVGLPAAVPRVSDANVRLTSTAVDDLLALITGIDGGTPVTSLDTITADLTAINDATGLTTLADDLNTGIGSLASDLTNLGNLADGIDLGGLQNIPYNLFADLVNVPYYESLAVEEEAFALGPGGSTGGVPGWIPPGATIGNGGVDSVTDQYTLGGTGSYLYESVGNTWGWDDGNWPQLDGLAHFLFPFQFEESITEQLQGFLQAESIDGADVNCEFQCASFLDYFGQWFHVPLSQLESGYTYPSVLADTVGGTSTTGVVNAGGTPVEPPGIPPGEDVIWSGQTFTLNPTFGLDAIGQNLTDSPAQDPIQFANADSLLLNSELLSYDLNYDFNFLTEGSFVFWGAPSLYSFPDLVGGTLQDFTGIPNQFLLPNDGAEPLSGYTDSYSSLLPGLEQGLQYLLNGDGVNGGDGLLGYLDPSTYVEALNNDASTFSADVGGLLSSLGLSAQSIGLSADSLSTFDPQTLLAGLDPTALTGDITNVLTNAANDLGGNIGSDLALNLLTSLI